MRVWAWLITVPMIASTACTGLIGEADGISRDQEQEQDQVPAAQPPDFEQPTLTPGPQTLLATPRLIRLSHEQWENTMADLFHDERPGLSANFIADTRYGAYDNNYRRLVVGDTLWGDYQSAAETIAAAQVQRLASWLPAGLPASGTARRDAFIREFGRRVFRRTLTEAEVSAYAALFDTGDAAYDAGTAFNDGVRITLEAMLQSPNLLYRAELSNSVVNGAVRLNGFEVASRLSYFVWNTMPDDELLDVADAGGLDDEAGLVSQLNRLLDDPRAASALERFHDQTYNLARYRDLDKDTAIFPGWNKTTHGEAYFREASMFLDDLVRNGGTFRDFLLSRTTFVNSTLAQGYGLGGSYGTAFVKAELPATRPGFMTRLGFLTSNAKRTQPDPVHRGLFMNADLLCRPLAPPPDVNTAITQTGVTNRQRYESVTGKGTCGEGCHGTVINPPGFALESFDAVGTFRTTDNGQPVDTSATYTFSDGDAVSFDGIGELMNAVAGAAEYHRCMSAHMVEYFYGREVLQGDIGLVDTIAQASLDDDADIRSLIEGIVTSRGFRERPVAELAEATQ